MRRRHMIAGVAAAVAAVAVSAGVQAYASYARWNSNSVVFYVNPANADVSASAAVSAVQAGMNAWNTQSGSAFRFEYGGQASDTATAVDNRNVVIFRNASNGSALATTYGWYSGTQLIDADIVFWDGAYTFFAGTSGCSGGFYIEDVGTHEFGHALGLLHSSVADATMYSGTGYCAQVKRTLAADDMAGAQNLYGSGGSSPTNSAPSVSVSSPVNGASVAGGASVAFTGAASDSQDGNLTPSLQWTANGTAIGSGGSFSTVLPAGNWTIVARVTDSGGLQASKSISITVASTTSSAPSAPSVSVNSPVNGASFAGSTSIAFTGAASDSQDGNLTPSLQWIANGTTIGSGGSFSKVLPAGTWTIVTRVTDSSGLETSKSTSITVTSSTSSAPPAPPAPPAPSAPSLTAQGRKARGLQQVDLSWNGITTSSLDVYRNNAKVLNTPNDGRETDSISSKSSGTYNYKVCEVGSTTRCSNTATVVF